MGEQFHQITPFMLVPDLERALAFFDDILGFKATYREPGYAYVERDDVAFHTHEPALFPWSHGPIARARRGRAARDIEAALDLLRAATDATRDIPIARLFPTARVRAPA